ncbi:MAG: hypothetical protein ACO2ZQ_09965, partial [Candidatus Puniceispirillaceae bacterium]
NQHLQVSTATISLIGKKRHQQHHLLANQIAKKPAKRPYAGRQKQQIMSPDLLFLARFFGGFMCLARYV